MRRRHRLPAPYEEPHRAPRSSQPLQPAEPSLPQQPTEEQALFNHAFTVTDLDATELPQGWHVDEQGYIQLDLSKMEDYWEVKSGLPDQAITFDLDDYYMSLLLVLTACHS